MKLKGAVTISKVQSNQTPEPWIVIQVADKSSRTTFCEVVMSLKDFAEAITGLGHLDCDVEVCGLDKLGLVREHQTVAAEGAYRESPYEESARKAYWQAWVEEHYPGWTFNYVVRPGVVSMVRWVEPEENDDAALEEKVE